MMKKNLLGGIVSLCLIQCFIFSGFSQLQVNADATAQEMSDAITGAGVISSSVTINCSNGAYGTFDGTITNLGIDQGILLTTGLAAPIEDCMYSINLEDQNGDGWTCGQIEVYIDGNLEYTLTSTAANPWVNQNVPVPVGSQLDIVYVTTGGAGCDENEHGITVTDPDFNNVVEITSWGNTNPPIPAGNLFSTVANCDPATQQNQPGFSAVGPNDINTASYDQGVVLNDPDLMMLNAEAINDVCVMEFDIIPSCDTLQINYVFASEEYPDFVCSNYNDMFGFFISGPGINGPFSNNAENMAVIPGTNQFVAINTVNSGSPGNFNDPSGCPGGGLDNSAFFVDNGNGGNCPGQPHCTDATYVRYNGMTVPMLAKSAVQPCQTYHMKLIIADAGDHTLDSGVFIDFEGLTCASTVGAMEASRDTIIEGCANTTVTVTRSEDANFAASFPIQVLGDATNNVDYTGVPAQVDFAIGETTQTFDINSVVDANAEGFELIRIAMQFDVCGIPANDTLDILIGDKPELTLTPTNPTCNEDNGAINAELNTLYPVVGYTWSANANGQTTALINDLGPGQYTVNISDGMGCDYTDQVDLVNVGDLSVLESITNNVCAGDCEGEIQLNITNEIGALNIAWTDADNNPIGNTNLIQNLCAGEYSVLVNDDVCDLQSTYTVTQPDSVRITVPNDTLICIDGTATFFVEGSFGVDPYTVNWGDGVFTNPRDFKPSMDSVVNVFVSDANGCKSEIKAIIIDLRDSIELQFTTPFNICQGDNIDIGVTASGGAGGYVYTWNNGLGDLPVHNVSPNSTTTYNVTVGDICETPSKSAEIVINVNTPVIPNISADPTEGCEPLTVQFTNTNIPNGGSCIWFYGDGSSSTNCGGAEHTYINHGTYDVSVQTTTAEGCDTTIILDDFINVHPVPNADFAYAPFDVTSLKPEVDFINLSTNNSNNEWLLEGSVFSIEENPEYTFPLYQPDTHYVCLRVSSDFGCADTVCKDVIINDIITVFAPNAFTPDQDNYNETWQIYVNGVDSEKFEIQIFNRWGERIWYTNSIDDVWDGKYKGKLVQDGTYVWTLSFKDIPSDKKFEYRGTVTVLR